MGTVITVDVRDPGVPLAVIDSVFRWFHEVDATFSTFREDSEISRLSRGELRESDCSRDVHEVLGLCEEVSRRSGGCFAIWRGGNLDPAGLVKGWSAERAAEMLVAEGARNFFIDAGGDVVARGHAQPGRPWRLGIRHPELRDRFAAVLAITDLAVATSGAYERGDHIVDPRSGWAPAGLLSMTVAGPSLTYADAYATAAFVMGEDGAEWVASIDGYEGLAITTHHRAVWTPGMRQLRASDADPAPGAV